MRGPWTWGRILELATWFAVAAMGALVFTQVFRIGQPYPIPVFQSLTPYLLLPAFPLAAVWNWRRRYGLAISNGLIGVSLLILMAPATMASGPPRPPDDAPRLRVVAANVLIGNTTPDAAASALLALDADVLALTEFDTTMHAALDRAGAAERYPYRAVRTGIGTEGLGLFSRFPISEARFEEIGIRLGADAELLVGNRSVRLLLVHPLPPTFAGWREHWAPDLRAIADRAAIGDGPTIVLGDFNATRWHPDFRRLLGRAHLRDAHEWAGDGLGTSWPADRGPIPPFVRLDHILVRSGVVPTGVGGHRIPGSDHVAMIADLAITA